jgi:hypothetical protein
MYLAATPQSVILRHGNLDTRQASYFFGPRTILDRPKLAALLGNVAAEWSVLEMHIARLYRILSARRLPPDRPGPLSMADTGVRAIFDTNYNSPRARPRIHSDDRYVYGHLEIGSNRAAVDRLPTLHTAPKAEPLTHSQWQAVASRIGKRKGRLERRPNSLILRWT